MHQSHPRYFDLSHFSLLEISGSDAFGFMHGQITADLNQLETQGWLFSAWCLPNGRVIGTFIVYANNDSLLMILPSMLKEKIMQRLSMFILRSQVSVNDVSEDYTLIGLSDTEIEKILQPTSISETISAGNKIQSEKVTCLKLWNHGPRYILISKMEHVEDLMNNITAICTPGERVDWNLLDIEAGMPWIINATSEAFLPQMLNLDQMHGLSYQKGCYPGQEVIARLYYRGQLKKMLYLGTGKADISPGAGDRLIIKNSGNVVADVIDAELHSSGGFRLLAVAETQYANHEDLCLESAPDIAVKLQPINYPV